MGRGDKKTKKGKIFKGSYGKSRPRKKKPVSKKKAIPKS
jgi:30S ribosomal protein S31